MELHKIAGRGEATAGARLPPFRDVVGWGYCQNVMAGSPGWFGCTGPFCCSSVAAQVLAPHLAHAGLRCSGGLYGHG